MTELRQLALNLRIVGALYCVRAALRVWGYARTRRLLERVGGARTGRGRARSVVNARQLAARMAAVDERLPGPESSCLVRSLALWTAVRRWGLAAELCLGGRRDSGFEAHAWVEVDGEPVNDEDDVATRFRQFERDLSPR